MLPVRSVTVSPSSAACIETPEFQIAEAAREVELLATRYFRKRASGRKGTPRRKTVYIQIAPPTSAGDPGKTAAIPVPPGQSLPPLPENAIRNPSEWAKVPGVKIVNQGRIAPGLDPSTYAYVKFTNHANLYRIPLQ